MHTGLRALGVRVPVAVAVPGPSIKSDLGIRNILDLELSSRHFHTLGQGGFKGFKWISAWDDLCPAKPQPLKTLFSSAF